MALRRPAGRNPSPAGRNTSAVAAEIGPKPFCQADAAALRAAARTRANSRLCTSGPGPSIYMCNLTPPLVPQFRCATMCGRNRVMPVSQASAPAAEIASCGRDFYRLRGRNGLRPLRPIEPPTRLASAFGRRPSPCAEPGFPRSSLPGRKMELHRSLHGVSRRRRDVGTLVFDDGVMSRVLAAAWL